jgi:addiction module HigA family antidote
MTGSFPAPLSERRPTHPGEILRDDVLPALKISVSEAARELGITRQMLHRVLNGEASVSPEMAIRLGKFCGNGATIWINMQMSRDLWDARQKLANEIEAIPTHKIA